MITLNGNTYNVSFVGDVVLDLTDPIAGSSLSVRRKGKLDTLTRPYSVRIDQKTAAQNAIARKKGLRDFEFPEMFLDSWTEVEDGPFVKFNVQFVGSYDGRTVEPEIKSGYRKQSVQLEYIGDQIGVTTGNVATFTYNAPYTTTHWVSRNKPQAARYVDKVDFIQDALDIVGQSGSAGNIALFKGRRLQGQTIDGTSFAITAGSVEAFNGVVDVTTSQFDFEQRGQWWEVIETNEVIIRPLNLYSSIIGGDLA